MPKTINRTYLETHPWINFNLDLRQIDPDIWLMLGKIQSKSQAINGIPLHPDYSQILYRIFIAKGVLATTAIEGNTLSEEEVLKRIEGDLELPPSKEYLGQEIDNIVAACNQIRDKVMAGKHSSLCSDEIREFNRMVFVNLPLQEDFIPGEFRNHSVGVGRYRGAPHQDMEYLCERLCEWINKDIKIPDGFEVSVSTLKAILCHLYLAWIHPFADGNGRTARLVEFEILLAAGFPDVTAHLLSNHYNQTRTEYYRQLDLSSKPPNGPISFIRYALQGFIDGLDEQLDMVRAQQVYVHWINYIHNRFRNKDGVADTRRRRLALDFSNLRDPVPLAAVRHISPRVAESYANLTDKTVARDIKTLVRMKLLRRTKDGYSANRELMRAFMPGSLDS